MKVKLPNEWAVSYQRFMSLPLVLRTNRANNQSLTESKNGQMFERALKINTIFNVLTSGLHILHSTYQTSTEVSVRESKCCVSRQFRTSNKAHAFEKESSDRIFHVQINSRL